MTLVFDPFTSRFARTHGNAFTTPADVTVGETDLALTMDLPGLTAEDLAIELADGYLSVRGERRQPEVGEGKSFVRAERAFGAFERLTHAGPHPPSRASAGDPPAVVGLLRALESFEVERGRPFWAYAAWWVRQAMQQLVAELTRPVVLSDRALRSLARLREAHNEALGRRARSPAAASRCSGPASTPTKSTT